MKIHNKFLLSDSCSLLGVIDPFGILEENEVFIQIRRDHRINIQNYEKNNKIIESKLDQVRRFNQTI